MYFGNVCYVVYYCGYLWFVDCGGYVLIVDLYDCGFVFDFGCVVEGL